MDWIGHHLDIAHWGMGWDETGPVEIEATGEFPTSGIYNSPTRYYVKAKYADGTPMVLAGGHDEIWGGTKWIGEYGWIWVDRGQFETEPDQPEARSHRPGRDPPLQEPRPLPELPRLRPQPGEDDRPGRDGPPLGQRRPPRRHRHGGRPEDQVGPGDRDDHRRPGGRAAPQPRLPQALAAARVRSRTMKNQRTHHGRIGRISSGIVLAASLGLGHSRPYGDGQAAGPAGTCRRADL